MAGNLHQLWCLELNGASCVDEHFRCSVGFPRGRSDGKERYTETYNSNYGFNKEPRTGLTRENYTELSSSLTRRPHDNGIVASPYSHNGELYKSYSQAVRDERAAYVTSLRTCTKSKNLKEGSRIHDLVLKRGLLEYCSDALITMYAKCGALAEAEDLLSTHNSRDVFSWTALISGYAQREFSREALECYERMQQEGLSPDEVTFACVLKACGSIGAVEKGKQIHDVIAKQGLLRNNVVVGTALVDMYAKCGALMKAREVLEGLHSRTAICWNALLAGYSQNGQGEQALNCFKRMQGEGLTPSAVTFTCILNACGSLGDINLGAQIHDQVTKRGLLKTDVVLGNALVDMYAKCGALEKAKSVLEELPFRNVISWSALIAGYALHGQAEQALDCFQLMLNEGISPNDVTFSCILKACGTLGALDKGKQIHDEILRQGLLRSNVVLGNALVDMYVKFGDLAKAQEVMEGLPSKDVYSWNTVIAGYAQRGHGAQALVCFERMQQDGVPPDVVTFSCVLNACNHLGLVDDGYNYFMNMNAKYGVKPSVDLYVSIIDLLGRAGNLEKVVELIQEMPSSEFSGLWHVVLSSCRKWGNVNVGRWAFERAIQIDKSDGAAYVLMANTYVAAGLQDNAKDIEAMRINNKAWEKPGCGLWIGAGGEVHSLPV
ncbi:hypothetical protein GOP47_0030477 [Adiantum capillus-veneris]|nr:hypothetical protein GOP47_0030477 [Adiantum capillus-veneris]